MTHTQTPPDFDVCVCSEMLLLQLLLVSPSHFANPWNCISLLMHQKQDEEGAYPAEAPFDNRSHFCSLQSNQPEARNMFHFFCSLFRLVTKNVMNKHASTDKPTDPTRQLFFHQPISGIILLISRPQPLTTLCVSVIALTRLYMVTSRYTKTLVSHVA